MKKRSASITPTAGSRKSPIVWVGIRIVVGALLVSSGVAIPARAASEADPCVGTRGSAQEVTVPSLEHRTIQSGVCAVEDGGRVNLLPGSYTERVTIWGKHVELHGTGNESHGWPVLQAALPAEVVPSAEVLGIISVRAGGSFTGRMFTLIGGDAGILVDEASGPVDVRHARFEQNGRGILHLSPKGLTVKHAVFASQLWNGISYAPPYVEAAGKGSLYVSHVAVLFADGMCLYEENGIAEIYESSFSFCGGGAVGAHASLILMSGVDITSAHKFGIALSNSLAAIDHTNISSTHATPSPEGRFLGDAIVVWASGSEDGFKRPEAQLSHIHTEGTDRAAVSNFGGHVIIEHSTFEWQGFHLFGTDKDGYEFEFEDGGGNYCTPDGPCVLTGESLEPPEPIGSSE